MYGVGGTHIHRTYWCIYGDMRCYHGVHSTFTLHGWPDNEKSFAVDIRALQAPEFSSGTLANLTPGGQNTKSPSPLRFKSTYFPMPRSLLFYYPHRVAVEHNRWAHLPDSPKRSCWTVIQKAFSQLSSSISRCPAPGLLPFCLGVQLSWRWKVERASAARLWGKIENYLGV